MKKYRAFSAGTVNPNTPESDKLPEVLHVVTAKKEDGSVVSVKIKSSDPMTAIDQVNELTDEQFEELLGSQTKA